MTYKIQQAWVQNIMTYIITNHFTFPESNQKASLENKLVQRKAVSLQLRETCT